jgi:gliding motility-associated-like protein
VSTKTLFASVKIEDTDDILIQINPQTGAHIPNAFGAGIDYVTISGTGILPIVEDIAINPINGAMFGLSRETTGNDLLITVDKNTGVSNVIGLLGENIIEGLGFDNEGRLFATPGAQTSPPQRFYEINTKTGAATEIAVLAKSGDYESCDCLTAPLELNSDPIASDDNYDTNINQQLTVEAPGILGNDTDPDGDSLTVIAFDSTSTNGGTVDLNADGSFTYTPAMDSMGIDTFTYIVSDGNGNTDTAMVSIIIKDPRVDGENRPPIAEDDEFMTDQDLELVVTDSDEGILINDSDPDGDNIAALEVNNAFTDQGGSISINANGTFSYTPSLGFVGVDTYEYTVCDDQDPQLCDNAIISIEVKELPVKVFDAFSPNGDGINDVWIIQGITRFPNNHVQIFNRWGNLVYQVRGYDNSANAWLGQSTEGITFGKNEVPDGGYFYVIDLGDGSERLSGFVVIRR